jgi:ubiquinone/menaquinone biosynthesis C-methylase UbiE
MERGQFKIMGALQERHWWYQGRRFVVTHLLQKYAAAIQQEGSILDIGCGVGEAASFVKNPARLTGIDESEEALTFAKEKGYAALHAGSADVLPFSDSQFKGALILDVLEHVERDGNMLRETFRVLDSSGLLMITVPAYAWLWSGHDVLFGHKRRYAKKELEEKVETAGFEILYVSHYVTFVFPLVLLFRMIARMMYGTAPRSHFFTMPWILNELLYATLVIEGTLMLWGMRLPSGSSLTLVARKKH